MSTIYGVDENSAVASVTVADRTSAAGAVGELKYFAGTTVPEHCLACDGSAISRTAYPELFAAIGTTYGSGDGSTTFNLPNANGVIYGQIGRTVGASVSAGLPNIEGNVWFRKSSAMSYNGIYSCPLFRSAWDDGGGQWGVDGAFTGDDPSSGYGYYTSLNIAWGSSIGEFVASQLAFNASESNSIYGNSTTVQPEGLVANVCIVYE